MKIILTSWAVTTLIFAGMMLWLSQHPRKVSCPPDSAYVARMGVCLHGAATPTFTR